MKCTTTLDTILKPNCTLSDAFHNFKSRTELLPSPFKKAEIIRHAFPEITDAVLQEGNDSFCGWVLLPGNSKKSQIGNPPGWHEDPYHNNEYVFQISRMNHWLPMLYTYFLTQDETYSQKLLMEMSHWIDVCPRPSLTDSQGNLRPDFFNSPEAKEWRLLECGIRPYRTWCPVLEGLASSPFFTEELFSKFIISLYEQCETVYLLSPLAWPKADHNHYLMENLGLLCTACMFPELRDSEIWKEHALQELCRCMEVQVDCQGAQIEGCPSYHNGCVFWFAMVMVYARKYNLKLPESYINRFSQMALYALYATRPNGSNVPWGDTGTLTGTAVKAAVCTCMGTGDTSWLYLCRHFFSYEDILVEAEEQIWRMDQIEEFCQALSRLKTESKEPKLPLLYYNKTLNHAYFRSNWTPDALSMMFACRCPIQNLHAHIDPCGFDFTAYGIPMVVDPGRYTYKNGEDRKHFKSMAWHNTLTVNHSDAWEYIHSWAYGPQKEGYITNCGEEPGLIWAAAAHNNYEPVRHTRFTALIENRFLLVVDRVSSLTDSDSLQLQFHIDRPSVELFGTIAKARWGSDTALTITTTASNPILLPGKVSDISDSYRDSSILQYQKEHCKETECFATILYPEQGIKAPEVTNLTAVSFNPETTENIKDAVTIHLSEENSNDETIQTLVRFTIEEHNYTFILKGGTL